MVDSQILERNDHRSGDVMIPPTGVNVYTPHRSTSEQAGTSLAEIKQPMSPLAGKSGEGSRCMCRARHR